MEKGSDPVKAADFLPPEEMSDEELEEQAVNFFTRMDELSKLEQARLKRRAAS